MPRTYKHIDLDDDFRYTLVSKLSGLLYNGLKQFSDMCDCMDTSGIRHNFNRSEGLDPNGICYPCVMGWGLAGPGNSSAVAAAAVVAPRGGGGGKIAKTRGFFKK